MRTHCFISTRSMSARGARWAWHTADENGVTSKHSDSEFDNFHACVDDARAHGYRHVEVPVLHWSAVEPTGTQARAESAADDGDEQDDILDAAADRFGETQ